MKTMKKIRNYDNFNRIVIFVVEAVCMILELCSSYLLYPYFGNSNTIWTAIITVILLSNCMGNLLGGKIHEKAQRNQTNYTSLIFFCIALCISLILGLNESVIYLVREFLPFSNNVNAFICSFALFMPCELLLGTIPPQIMYHESEKDGYNASKTGIVYALSTMGGLFGTVLSGFVLIPLMGCKNIIIICVAVTLVLAIIFDTRFWKKTKSVICLLISVGISFAMLTYKEPFDWEKEDYGNLKVDSQYNRIIVQNDFIDNDKVRKMLMASGYESATYLEPGKRNELIFDYLKKLDETVYQNENIKSNTSLMIGGAAYQYPKYLLSHYASKKMDVVEIDEVVTKLAKEYFFLQDCIDKYDPNGERLKLINNDGRVFLEKAGKYDVIFNDAFAGDSPVTTLCTKEFIQTVKSKLNSGGVYAMNIISTRTGDDERFLCAECNTLSQVFVNVYILPCEEVNPQARQNFIVIATDKKLDFPNELNIDFSKGLVLTDDYSPVEYLYRK